jgi:hypothetical protein
MKRLCNICHDKTIIFYLSREHNLLTFCSQFIIGKFTPELDAELRQFL